jgi:hypothetical protein
MRFHNVPRRANSAHRQGFTSIMWVNRQRVLQADAGRIVAQVPLLGKHVAAAGSIGDELGADGLAFFSLFWPDSA